MSRPLSILAAPWRASFLSQINGMDLPVCSLGTLHHPQDILSTNTITPRCRTLVFRGLWAELPPNDTNKAQLNPSLFETDLLTFTTDARMEKIPGISFGDSASHDSGGGARVEAVFWASPSKTQWRIRGIAYFLGPDIDEPSALPVKQAIELHMRPKSGGGSHPWSWSQELTAHFGNLSPGMRGSFRNPPPGTVRAANPPPGFDFGLKLENLEDELARKNFRVVVVVPEEVDRLDLSKPADPRRWNYKLAGNSWKEVELWP